MIYLDDRFPDHPKVVKAGDEAGWMYVAGLGYSNRNGTLGRIPKAMVNRLTNHRKPTLLAERLVDANLWEDDGDHYVIHDYEPHNKSAIARSEHAKKAAEARWGKQTNGAQSNARASEEHVPEQEMSMTDDDGDFSDSREQGAPKPFRHDAEAWPVGMPYPEQGENGYSQVTANTGVARASFEQCPSNAGAMLPSRAGARPHAHQAPSPKRTTSSSVSEEPLGGLHSEEEEEDPEVEAEVQRRLASSRQAGTVIANVKAWEAKTRAGILNDIATQGRAVLEPPPPVPPDPVETTAAAQRERAKRNEARARGEACAACEGYGQILGGDDIARPCRACGPARLSVVGE